MIGNHRGEPKDATLLLIPPLFLSLLTVEIPAFLRKKAKLPKKIKNSEDEESFQFFVQKIEDFLQHIIPHKTSTYPKLFFSLMKELSRQKGDKWRFFTPQNRAIYSQLFSIYILKEKFVKKSDQAHDSSGPNTNYSDKEQFSPPEHSILSTSPNGFHSFLKSHNIHYKNSHNNNIIYDSKVYINEGKEILSYFENYSQDPFSTLIGRKPSELILKASLKYDGNSPLSHGEIIIGISTTDENSIINSILQHAKPISKSQSILHSKSVKRKAKSESLMLRSARAASSERLNNNYFFVRYLHSNDDLTVEAQISMEDKYNNNNNNQINNNQNNSNNVNNNNNNNNVNSNNSVNQTKKFVDFLRIPQSFVGEIIDTTSPENLRNFIENPCDQLLTKILQLSRSKLVEYLKNQESFDFKIFETMELYQYHNQRIQDYWIISRNEQFLQNIYPKISQEFKDNLNDSSKEISEQFLAQQENNLFIPTLEKEILLIHFYPQQALLSSINAICGKYQNVIDDIKRQITEVINGSRKTTLLNWWLKEITTHVYSFLSSKNYLHKAVPENYLEDPPDCMKNVKFNLNLLKKILDPENTSFSPSQIIQELKELIYPKINQLIVDIKYSIIILLKEEEGEYECNQIKEKFEAKKEKINDENLKFNIENSLKDLDYLVEMIKLEDPIYAANSRSFHIVPISGLAFSNFFRLENECRTVLEYWSRRLPAIPQSPLHLGNTHLNSQSYSFKMKRAISIGDLSEFKNLLHTSKSENRMADFNQLDANGWNVFHCCAAKENISMCKMLLLNEEIDVNIQNCDGNSPLHFLSRIKQPEYEEELIEIVKKCISKGANVHSVNKYQETPLHSCFRGFSSIGKLLLDNGADPNYPTLREETPLHYAVKAENLGMIKVLLEAGADPYIGNSNGDTPYSLAIRFKNPIAESMLTK